MFLFRLLNGALYINWAHTICCVAFTTAASPYFSSSAVVLFIVCMSVSLLWSPSTSPIELISKWSWSKCEAFIHWINVVDEQFQRALQMLWFCVQRFMDSYAWKTGRYRLRRLGIIEYWSKHKYLKSLKWAGWSQVCRNLSFFSSNSRTSACISVCSTTDISVPFLGCIHQFLK